MTTQTAADRPTQTTISAIQTIAAAMRLTAQGDGQTLVRTPSGNLIPAQAILAGIGITR